jgi:aryl-alcohol dehydrogenase-like predicted oxidoreductase
MRTRPIGSLQVSVVGLGCNNFGGRVDAAGAAKVVHAALDAGITLFDTADVYGRGLSEEYLGAALKGARDEVIIATKFGHPMTDDDTTGGASARWIRQAVDDSLRRLGTDRIDLIQQHVPDDATPIEETLEALASLVQAGKVREIGNSNFDAKQLRAADDVARSDGRARFVSAQNHFSLLAREVEDEVLPACAELGLGMLPYFPLASGMLTGKYRRDTPPPAGTRLGSIPEERRERWMNERAFDVAERLEAFAVARGRTPVEAAIAWLLAKPAVVSVIAGATQPDQVVANAAAASWEMTADEVAEVDAL